VRKLFKDLDSDKNGIIDPEEFKMAMRKLGVKINDDLLTRMHRDADHDKSGGGRPMLSSIIQHHHSTRMIALTLIT
jgi:Ca2+-binding EF-hand superfamily protein